MSDWTHDRLKASTWRGEPWTWAHAKLDGFRATVFRQSDGRVVVYGRDTRHHLELSHRFISISESTWLARLQVDMPPLSSVDGELISAGSCSSDVPTALRGTPDDLRFVAFAVPQWNNHSLIDADLTTIRDLCEDMSLNFAPIMVEYDTKFCKTCKKEDQKSTLMVLAKQCGYEGWVLKDSHYKNWYKVKETKSIDCFVTGVKDGDGKYLGLLGSLRVSVYNESGDEFEIASVSGMTDAERVEMSELDDDQLIDRVCEVEYQCIGSKGKLRHPRFKKWRPDKPKTECVMEAQSELPSDA